MNRLINKKLKITDQRAKIILFLIILVYSFQNCTSSMTHFSPTSSDINSTSSSLDCTISGPNQVGAGLQAGPYSVACKTNHTIVKHSWTCDGSEAACQTTTKSDEAQFSITPAAYSAAEKVPINVVVETADGLKGTATLSLDITALLQSTELCGYNFRLNVNISAVTGAVPMDLKNAGTCRCNLNAELPGMKRLSPGRYRINDSNDEMILSEQAQLDKTTNTATCNLRCANSNNEPSVSPKGLLFCSSCKVPASIRESTAHQETKTWEFIKDDAKKVCYYNQMDASSYMNLLASVKNPAIANSNNIKPTFKLRDLSNVNEPAVQSLGFSPGSIYYKMDVTTGDYKKFDATLFVPNCQYYEITESSDAPGYLNPANVCTTTTFSSGRFEAQVQIDPVAQKENARYFWCSYKSPTYASGDCLYSPYGSSPAPGGGGGSGGGFNP